MELDFNDDLYICSGCVLLKYDEPCDWFIVVGII